MCQSNHHVEEITARQGALGIDRCKTPRRKALPTRPLRCRRTTTVVETFWFNPLLQPAQSTSNTQRVVHVCFTARQLVKPGGVLTTLRQLAKEREVFFWVGLGCAAAFVLIGALSTIVGQRAIRRGIHLTMMASCVFAVSADMTRGVTS